MDLAAEGPGPSILTGTPDSADPAPVSAYSVCLYPAVGMNEYPCRFLRF